MSGQRTGTLDTVRDALIGLEAHKLEFDEMPVNEEWEASQ